MARTPKTPEEVVAMTIPERRNLLHSRARGAAKGVERAHKVLMGALTDWRFSYEVWKQAYGEDPEALADAARERFSMALRVLQQFDQQHRYRRRRYPQMPPRIDIAAVQAREAARRAAEIVKLRRQCEAEAAR